MHHFGYSFIVIAFIASFVCCIIRSFRLRLLHHSFIAFIANSDWITSFCLSVTELMKNIKHYCTVHTVLLSTIIGSAYQLFWQDRLPTVLPHDSPNLLLILVGSHKFGADLVFWSLLEIGKKIKQNFGEDIFLLKLTEISNESSKAYPFISLGQQHRLHKPSIAKTYLKPLGRNSCVIHAIQRVS